MRILVQKIAATVFGRDEDGAVTVDWVVLAAATIGFGLAVGSVFYPKFLDSVKGVKTEFVNATK